MTLAALQVAVGEIDISRRSQLLDWGMSYMNPLPLMMRRGKMTTQPGSSSPGSLISKVRRAGSCETFARAFRLLSQVRLSPNLVALQSTGDAPTLSTARATLEVEESPVFEKSSCARLAKTRSANRNDERTI